MPLYEYHCPSCRETFELLRPMSRSSEIAICPAGHPNAERVLSLVADLSRGTSGGGPGPAPGGGGCGGGGCGGACACSGQ